MKFIKRIDFINYLYIYILKTKKQINFIKVSNNDIILS